MKYDYMTKERPNIYQPSLANQPDDSTYEKDIIKLRKDAAKAKAAATKAALANNISNESVDSGFAYKDTNDLFEDDDHHSSYPQYGENISPNNNDDEGFEAISDWDSVSDSKPRRGRCTDDSSADSAAVLVDTDRCPSEKSPQFEQSNSCATLDSIIEIKEILPDTYSCTNMYKKTADDIGPQQQKPNGENFGKSEDQQEIAMSRPRVGPSPSMFKVPLRPAAENWRYRNNEEKKPHVTSNTKNSRSVNVSFSRSTNNPTHGRYTSDTPITRNNDTHLRNWRNECTNNVLPRNCGMSASRVSSAARAVGKATGARLDSDEYLGFGLSPPSESLMMQRRQRINSRSSDSGPLLCSPVSTASG